jgi:hypothetical protein
MSYLQDALRGRLLTAHEVEAVKSGKTRQRFDGANEKDGKEYNLTLDKIVAIAAMAQIRTQAAHAVQVWAETDDLDKGETLYDRLDALISYIADGGIDLDDDPATDDRDDIYMVAMQAASDYMSVLGADDADLEVLFNSKDDDARDEVAQRLVEFLMQTLGEDEDAAEDAVQNFAFDLESESDVFDSANFKKTVAIRDGKKVILKKRLGSKLKRTAKQKAALIKAQMKAHSGSAKLKRQKSLNVGKKANLY